MSTELEQIEYEVWLNYFNSYLYEHGWITRDMQEQMSLLIAQNSHKQVSKR